MKKSLLMMLLCLFGMGTMTATERPTMSQDALSLVIDS